MQPSTIIVVLPNWIGDVVMATPALRALRRHYPATQITYVARPYVADVVADLGWSDNVVLWPTADSHASRKQGLIRLARQLRRAAGGRPDWAVLLTNSFRSALLATLAGARRRIGYDRDGRGLLLTDRLLAHRQDGKFLPSPMVKYYNSVVGFLGCKNVPADYELPDTPAYDALFDELAGAVGLTAQRPLVVIHAGAAFGESKCWPSDRFARVADILTAEDNAQVVFTCGPNEQAIIGAIRAKLTRPAILLDKTPTTLRQVMALIRRADLLICNDTGPRHFAIAYQTPVVTLFGPTDPRWTESHCPLERRLLIPVPCGPCQKRLCPLKHHDCMTRITVEAVVAQARNLLGQTAQANP